MSDRFQIAKSLPFFLWLLPLLFATHGYNQSSLSFTRYDILEFAAKYSLLATGLFLSSRWFLGHRVKAAILSLAFLFVFLYFGPILDVLKSLSPGFFLAKYSVLLPLLLVGFGLFAYYLKKTKRQFSKLAFYFNVLFLALLLVEIPALFKKEALPPPLQGLNVATTGNKPDVYLIIADEYPDSTALAETLHFNNGNFLTELRNRGFYINKKTKGNYNYTPFAVASLLGMDYLPGPNDHKAGLKDLNTCFSRINKNALLSFFQNSGYEIRNLSIFNVADQEPQANQSFIPLGRDRLAAQTMPERLKKDLGYHLGAAIRLLLSAENDPYYTKHCNETLMDLFETEVRRKTTRPRFIYTHLLMPHPPYYNDSAGKERPREFFTQKNLYHKEAFLGYLRYSNKVFLKMIDEIRQNAVTPPVILFMGDHGFRWFDADIKSDNPYFYMNVNTVFLPDHDYRGFYEGMSNVNQFRVLLNQCFGQQLPILKDTTYFISD